MEPQMMEAHAMPDRADKTVTVPGFALNAVASGLRNKANAQFCTSMGSNSESVHRGYVWKLYPSKAQAEALRQQARMVAELWNALLERHETIRSRTVQYQKWTDADGEPHRGMAVHALTYESISRAAGTRNVVPITKSWTCYDMQNEVTYMRGQLPEWGALSCWTALRVPQALDEAFQAFYRRAKAGAGGSAGYPKFKRVDRARSIPHRFASGCKLTRDPRHEKSWVLVLKGIDGAIHARGILPAHAEKFLDADVTCRNGTWWLSVSTSMERQRQSRRAQDFDIRWDLLDGAVRVNGAAQQIPGMAKLVLDERAIDATRSDIDTRWPRHARLTEEERAARREALSDLWLQMDRVKRRRANALHVWTARIVSVARTIHVTIPRISQHTRSGRGNEREWGANVKTIAVANRGVLAQGAAAATAMLKYKAEEAGVKCMVETESAPEVTVMRDLKKSGQKIRKASRQAKHEGKKQKAA